MLLGEVPAQTAGKILEPLLSNFIELMLQLPHYLQVDFENILRIYPDVADRFHLKMKPPIIETLRRFSEHRRSSAAHEAGAANGWDSELDIAAEPQKELRVSQGYLLTEGQGFFNTDRGRSVYLEFFYSEGDDYVSFECEPAKFEIEIHICGIYIVSLGPGEPKKNFPANALFKILEESAHEADIKIVEESRN